ncbi:hypothetical protein CsatA_016238 [Cannabis sativa]
MLNCQGSPLPQSSSGDEFHSDVGNRSPTCPETFSYSNWPSGEAIVGRMMRAYQARPDDTSSSSDEEWLQNFFENEGQNVPSTANVLAEFHALRLRAERRCNLCQLRARNHHEWHKDLERKHLANKRWMEQCLRDGVPFYPPSIHIGCCQCKKRLVRGSIVIPSSLCILCWHHPDREHF